MTISSIEKEFEEKFKSDISFNYTKIKDIKSFYRQKIEAFGKEVREEENQAWIDGKRCHYCGRVKKYDALCDTCDDCLDN